MSGKIGNFVLQVLNLVKIEWLKITLYRDKVDWWYYSPDFYYLKYIRLLYK